jgi:DNA-binding beta-propeller fold protein YncE
MGIRRSTVMLAILAVGALTLLPLVSAQVAGGHSVGGASGVIASPSVTCATGSGPYYPGYDPVNHDLYVPNDGAGTITVLNRTCHLVGTITLPSGASPEAATFNPASDRMYVTDDSLDFVYVINGLKVTQTISNTLLTDPISLIWDPGDSMILVTNSYAGFDVVAIRGSSVLGSVPVGIFPGKMCYDPYFNTILVVNEGSRNVTILNAYDPLGPAVANVPVGFDPAGCAFDVTDNYDYVTNFGDDNVSVLYGNGVAVGSVNVGSLPAGIAWDPAKLRMYVVDTGSGNLSIIRGLKVVKTVKAGIKSAEGLAYDDANNKMYVASYSGDKVYVES